jgi:hypothetical protein
MEGEFHAMSALHKADNLFAPKPHAWGKRSGPGPETYFFILQYIDMSDRFPDPNQLWRGLAQLASKQRFANREIRIPYQYMSG